MRVWDLIKVRPYRKGGDPVRRGVGGPVGMRKGIKLRMGYESHAVE